MSIELAPDIAFKFLMILVRVAAMLMLLPAIGEATIPGRIRLGLAFTLAFILYPVVGPMFAPPSGLGGLVVALGFEITIGLFIGATARLVMSAVQFAGGIIAFQSGLAFAQSFDPTQGVQSAIVGSFLSVFAVALIFALDLHHLLLTALADSFTLFRPGAFVPVADVAELAVSTVADAFVVAVQLAAPFLVFGLVFYVGLGILSRLMPQVQIFFVAMPANIFLGLLLLMLLVGAIGLWFTEYFALALGPFLV
jgi:flagellar biosynthetic protein FliR